MEFQTSAEVISHFALTRHRILIYPLISMDDRTFLKSGEIARALGISRRTLALWVKQGRIPEPLKSSSGYFLWTEADLLHFRGLGAAAPGPQAEHGGKSGAA